MLPLDQHSAPTTHSVSKQLFPSWTPKSSPPSFSPTSTVSLPPMRSISSSVISSGNSLANASHAATPSLWHTFRNLSSPAKPPWPDSEQTNHKPRPYRSPLAPPLPFPHV